MNRRERNKCKRIWKRNTTPMSLERYIETVTNLRQFLINNNVLHEFSEEAAKWNTMRKWSIIKNWPFKRSSYKVYPMHSCDAFMGNRGITKSNAVEMLALRCGDAIKDAFAWTGSNRDWCFWSNLSNDWECIYNR